MGPSRILSPRPFLLEVGGSGGGSDGFHPSGDWSTPILAPCTRPPSSLPTSVYARKIDFLSDYDYTMPVTRSLHVVVFGNGGRNIKREGVATGGRGVFRARAHPHSNRPTLPGNSPIISPPRSLNRRYIRDGGRAQTNSNDIKDLTA